MVLSVAGVFVLLACVSLGARLGHRGIVAPLPLLALEHGALACQVAALAGVVALMAPSFAALLVTGGVIWVAADAALFVSSGMRLQMSSLAAVGKARAMAPGMPWRRYAIGLGMGAGVLWVLTLQWLRWYAAAAHAAGVAYGPGHEPVAGAGTVGGALFAAGIAAGLGVMLAWVAEVYRGRLPMEIAYAWNLRIIVWQGRRLRAWTRRRTSSAGATSEASQGSRSRTTSPKSTTGGSSAGLLTQHEHAEEERATSSSATTGLPAGLVPQREHAEEECATSSSATTGLPAGLVPQREHAEEVDAKYPLLRRSVGFTGEKHFALALAPDERPHVVWLFLESFRAADTGILRGVPAGQSLTPCFDALARNGVLWSDFYANGTITSLAMLSALYGVPPPLLQRQHQQPFVMPPLLGMPHLFAEHGYLPAYFCDGPLDWENKRMFSLHQGFRLFYGAPSIKVAYPQAPESVWHFRDEFLMRFHANWLAEEDARGQATFSTLLTVSNHFPWEPPPEAPRPAVDLDPESVLYRYMRTTMYTDWCLGLYMDLLRERGLDRKTIFLVLGDHAQQVNDANDVSWSGRYTSEGVRVPCLLLAPGRITHKVIDEIASQVDLIPTFLDIFSMRAMHHAVGTSLVRECVTREALSVHPWAPGMAATRFDRWRHVYNLEAEHSALYDVRVDPQEMQNEASHQRTLVHNRQTQLENLRDTLNALYEQERVAPPQDMTYLQSRFFHHAPEGFPRTLEECRTRLQSLRANTSPTRPKAHTTEVCILLLALETTDLTDVERLTLAQLLLARLYIDWVGELTDAEDAQLQALEAKAVTPNTMPSWDRALVEGVRPMAQNKPGQFFRTAR